MSVGSMDSRQQREGSKMALPNEPDWKSAEALIVTESTKAIEVFSRASYNAPCSCFALSVDYSFGDITICFDTYANTVLHARRHEARTVKGWDSVFAVPKAWEDALYYIRRDRLTSHNPHTADFSYPNFAKIHIADWEPFFMEEQEGERPDPLGHVIVLFHKIVNALVSTSSFDALMKSSPFRIAVEFPSDDLGLVVMRLLNWPSNEMVRA